MKDKMNITAANFLECLPLVTNSIYYADYLAFDTEFSGLTIGFDDNQHDFDSLETRYQKLKHACQRCNAFQIGLATFKWIEKEKAYSVRAFNFYVFPHSSMMDK
jgi:poly(A)-specific ribonuclease